MRSPTRIRSIKSGQGLAEYALILALIAIVAVIALIFLGGQVSKTLSAVNREQASPSASPVASALTSGGIQLNPISGTTVLASGPTPSDGATVLVRVNCPGATGVWRPADAGSDKSWTAQLTPTSPTGCLAQAAAVQGDSVVIFGELPIELPASS